MEQVRNFVYDQIIDKHNLLEATIVRYENERRYDNNRSLNVFNTLICQLTSIDVKN